MGLSLGIIRFVLFFVVAGVWAAGPPPSNTTIGTFGPLNVYQPFADWLYPINESFPLQITLGNGSLALYAPTPSLDVSSVRV
jgi:hypothetical protein